MHEIPVSDDTSTLSSLIVSLEAYVARHNQITIDLAYSTQRLPAEVESIN